MPIDIINRSSSFFTGPAGRLAPDENGEARVPLMKDV